MTVVSFFSKLGLNRLNRNMCEITSNTLSFGFVRIILQINYYMEFFLQAKVYFWCLTLNLNETCSDFGSQSVDCLSHCPIQLHSHFKLKYGI